MPETPKPPVPDRCRLVLIIPDAVTAASADIILQALDGGDVASLIIPVGGRDEVSLQKLAEAVVPAAQERGVAVVIESDTRIAGRVGADGVHLEGSPAALREAIDHLGGRLMVGTGGAKTRDDALDLGEMQPDYMFFGRFGFDNKPEAHSRNLKLAEWWSQMIALPCIVLGGNSLQSVPDAAATGAEFVALSAAIFAGANTPAQAVAEANRLLDAHAPAFAE
jgi:thiamine-phosphate pyrophosphorylase